MHFRTEKPGISPGNYQYVNISNILVDCCKSSLSPYVDLKHFTKLKIGRLIT